MQAWYSRYVSKYDGFENEFEPGSRGRVLRNKLGIKLVREIERAETKAFMAAYVDSLLSVEENSRFTSDSIKDMHKKWLGGIYDFAGDTDRWTSASPACSSAERNT